jgi:hypothetical protein
MINTLGSLVGNLGAIPCVSRPRCDMYALAPHR